MAWYSECFGLCGWALAGITDSGAFAFGVLKGTMAAMAAMAVSFTRASPVPHEC